MSFPLVLWSPSALAMRRSDSVFDVDLTGRVSLLNRTVFGDELSNYDEMSIISDYFLCGGIPISL